jgi:hypothetical protein
MLARVYSCAVFWLKGVVVEVEVDSGQEAGISVTCDERYTDQRGKTSADFLSLRAGLYERIEY